MSSYAEIDPVVFILDSDSATREPLRTLMGASGWRMQTYTSAVDFLGSPCESRPSCLVLNAVLSDMCGLELQRLLADSRPHLAIVFIAARADVAAGVRAMKSGAVDFLSTPLADHEIVGAVNDAIERSRTWLARAAELQTLSKNYATLSCREREVMALVTSGLLNKQAGGKLGISEITVKAHRGHAMRKMDARNFADLVNKANKLRSEMAHL